jgi:hypothetical protein
MLALDFGFDADFDDGFELLIDVRHIGSPL